MGKVVYVRDEKQIPSQFFLHLELGDNQQAALNELISFLEDVASKHVQHPQEKCPTCGMSKMIPFADTWCMSDVQDLRLKIEILKKIQRSEWWIGDHT